MNDPSVEMNQAAQVAEAAEAKGARARVRVRVRVTSASQNSLTGEACLLLFVADDRH